jgi:hypothetical protein
MSGINSKKRKLVEEAKSNMSIKLFFTSSPFDSEKARDVLENSFSSISSSNSNASDSNSSNNSSQASDMGPLLLTSDDSCQSSSSQPELEFAEEAMSSRKTPTTTESLKSDLFSLIDTLIKEIEERFGDKQRLMYRAFAELLDLDDEKGELSFEAVFEFFNVSSLDQQFFLARWKLFIIK